MGILDCIRSLWTDLTHNLSTLQRTGVVLAVAVSVHVCIRRFSWNQSPPPGPISYPGAPHLPAMGKKPHVVFMEVRQQYGDVFRIQMGSIPTVVISGKLVREALTQHADTFSGRPQFSRSLTPKNGLTTLTFGKFDESWTLHKKIATDVLMSFHNGCNSLVQSIINCEIKTLLKEFEDKRDASFNPEGNILMVVASVGFQICYGRRENVRSDKDFCEYIKLNGRSAGIANSTNTVPWLRCPLQNRLRDLKKSLQDGETMRTRLIKEHITTYKDRHIRDVMDCLIKAAKNLTEDDKRLGMSAKRVVGTIGDLFAGGLDTLHTVITWSLLLLTVYNRVQVNVHKELDDIVGRTRVPTLEDRHRLPYLQATIHEILRFTSVTPLSIPHTTTTDVKLAGYAIRKDTRVFVNLYSLGHDPEIWGDPTTFRPERFLTDTGSVNTSMVEKFLPFSAGTRCCPGESLARAEIFLILSALLQRCSLARARDVSWYSLEPSFGVNQTPLPYRIQVRMRT